MCFDNFEVVKVVFYYSNRKDKNGPSLSPIFLIFQSFKALKDFKEFKRPLKFLQNLKTLNF